MRRLDVVFWVIGLPVLLGLVAGLPVGLIQARGQDVTYGPAWLWWAVLGAFLLAFAAAEALTGHPRRHWPLSVFVVQAALAIALVMMLRGGFGFTAVILVFSTALSCYVLPRWGIGLVIVANTAAVVTVAWRSQGWVEAGLTGLFYLFIQVVSTVTVLIWQRQQTINRELTEAHVELSATSALLEESTRSAERLRISRDLHDRLGHQLTALSLELEVAAHQAEEPARDHVLRARGVAKDLLADVRAAVSDLREDDGELEATLRRVIADVPLNIHLRVAPGTAADQPRTTALVRAVQEVLTNTLRHSGEAENLWIEIDGDGDGESLVLSAHDDGWGPASIRIGNGLRGLRERAEALGGGAEFSRHADGGFSVRMEVPA